MTDDSSNRSYTGTMKQRSVTPSLSKLRWHYTNREENDRTMSDCIVGECYSAQTFAVYLTHHRGPVLPIDSPRQACLLVPLDLPSNWHNFWPITCQPGHLPQQTVLGVLYVLTCTFYLPPEALSITTLHEVLCLGPLATFPNMTDTFLHALLSWPLWSSCVLFCGCFKIASCFYPSGKRRLTSWAVW